MSGPKKNLPDDRYHKDALRSDQSHPTNQNNHLRVMIYMVFMWQKRRSKALMHEPKDHWEWPVCALLLRSFQIIWLPRRRPHSNGLWKKGIHLCRVESEPCSSFSIGVRMATVVTRSYLYGVNHRDRRLGSKWSEANFYSKILHTLGTTTRHLFPQTSYEH